MKAFHSLSFNHSLPSIPFSNDMYLFRHFIITTLQIQAIKLTLSVESWYKWNRNKISFESYECPSEKEQTNKRNIQLMCAMLCSFFCITIAREMQINWNVARILEWWAARVNKSHITYWYIVCASTNVQKFKWLNSLSLCIYRNRVCRDAWWSHLFSLQKTVELSSIHCVCRRPKLINAYQVTKCI